MTFGNRLKHLRLGRKLTQDEIAIILGTSKQVISRYENGQRTPKIDVANEYANKLGVPLDYLLGDDSSPKNVGTPYTPTHKIPILGCVSAGLPLYADEHIEGYTYTDLNGDHEYFALRVQGDSMNAARILEGDILIVRHQPIVENGEIAVVLVERECATVKQFYRSGNTVTLVPRSTNSEHQIQVYDLRKIQVDVLGLVVENKISIN